MENAGMVYEATLKSRVINKIGEREDVLFMLLICRVILSKWKSL